MYLCAKRTASLKLIIKIQEMCKNDLQIIFKCTHRMRNIDSRVYISYKFYICKFQVKHRLSVKKYQLKRMRSKKNKVGVKLCRYNAGILNCDEATPPK